MFPGFFSNSFCYLFWARTQNLDLSDSENNYSRAGPLVSCHLHLVLLPSLSPSSSTTAAVCCCCSLARTQNMDLSDSENDYSRTGPLVSCHLCLVLLPSLCPSSSTATAVCCCYRLPVHVRVHTWVVAPLRSRSPRHHSLSILHFFSLSLNREPLTLPPWLAVAPHSLPRQSLPSEHPFIACPPKQPPSDEPLAQPPPSAARSFTESMAPSLLEQAESLAPTIPVASARSSFTTLLNRGSTVPQSPSFVEPEPSPPLPPLQSRADWWETPPLFSPLALGAATHLLALCLAMSSEEEEPSCCSLVYILVHSS
jgi:hypothetical protein